MMRLVCEFACVACAATVVGVIVPDMSLISWQSWVRSTGIRAYLHDHAGGVVSAWLTSVLLWPLVHYAAAIAIGAAIRVAVGMDSWRHALLACTVMTIVAVASKPYVYFTEYKTVAIQLFPWIALATQAALLLAACGCIPLRTRRLGRDACVSCGYNLTGNVSGRCPECGRMLADGADGKPGALVK